MSKKFLRVGVIGCGRVFDHYLKIFNKKQLSYLQLVACCDENQKKLNKVNSQDIKKYNNYKTMLLMENLDLVLILTPSGSHYKHSKYALLKGVNVLCEKPMGLNVRDCKKLMNISKKSKAFYGVVFQNRLNNAIKFLRKNIITNKLGKIIFCNVRLIWCRYNNYYKDGWHGTWKMDGGVLNQQLIHHLDVIINIVSKVLEINSFSSTIINKLECEDTISASFKLKNGALGQIIGTTGFRPKDTEASIELITNKGIFKIGGIALNEISSWVVNGKENKKKLQKFSEEFENGYGNGHEKMLKMLSQKLLFKKKVDEFSWSPKLALETSKVVSKIYRATEIKRNIRMSDNNYSLRLGVKNAK